MINLIKEFNLFGKTQIYSSSINLEFELMEQRYYKPPLLSLNILDRHEGLTVSVIDFNEKLIKIGE